MKPTVSKRKNLSGRILCHVATIGPFEGQGSNATIAIEAVEAGVSNGLTRLERGMFIRHFMGHVAVISPSVAGWTYWIDTSSSDSPQETGSSDLAEAIGKALHHLAQNVWEPTVEDDTAFVSGLPTNVAAEVSRWIRFQRSYAKLRAEGKSDVDAYLLACSA